MVGFLASVKDIDEAIEISNNLGPEHLQLSIKNSEQYLDKIQSAGCEIVSLGPRILRVETAVTSLIGRLF